jgi:hypothetical protein
MKKINAIFCLMVMLFSFAAMAEGTTETERMTFQEVDSLWKVTSFLKNEAPTESHFMAYGEGDISGRVRYFENQDHQVMMVVAEMPQRMLSQQVSLQLKVDGKSIDVPKKVSYQEYNHPKIIKGAIVVRAHVGVHPEGDYFYVVIHKGTHYLTQRSAEVEFLLGK